MILNIDITEGVQDRLFIFKNNKESIRTSANEFVNRNHLNIDEVLEPLISHIE